MADRAHDGQPFRILNLIDEYSRKCLALRVRRELKAQDVVEVLAEQFFQKGLLPAHLRFDNGPEFTAKAVRAGGWKSLESRVHSSNPIVPGRMVITNHSMANSGTNCSIKVTKKKSSRQTKGKGSRDLKSGLDAKVAENAEKLNRRKLDALKKRYP